MMSNSQQEFVRALDGLIDEIVIKTVKEHINDIVEAEIHAKLQHHFNVLSLHFMDKIEKFMTTRLHEFHRDDEETTRRMIHDILSDTSFSANIPPKI